MHTINMLFVGLFPPLSPQSVIVCSPNRILVSNILTDVVDKSFSDSNWTTTALLHQWCPWCPAPHGAGYLDVVEIFPNTPIKDCSHSLLLRLFSGVFIACLLFFLAVLHASLQICVPVFWQREWATEATFPGEHFFIYLLKPDNKTRICSEMSWDQLFW